jgi:hypothetical protein
MDDRDWVGDLLWGLCVLAGFVVLILAVLHG